MIRVRRRPPEPPVLTEADGRGMKERAAALRAFEDYRAAVAAGAEDKGFKFAFSAYKDAAVKQRLEQLFHGKCAYCESRYSATQPMDVEHYRPKGSVAEDRAHPGYYWLAAEWDNLLPSCIDCNRKRKQFDQAQEVVLALGKQDQFPVDGVRASDRDADLEAERPLLLDPCRGRNPKDILAFDSELAVVLPRASRGHARRLAEESIRVYGLNRGELVLDRQHVLRLIQHRLELVRRMTKVADRIASHGGLDDILELVDDVISMVLKEIFEMRNPDRPYAALARDVIAQLGAHLDEGP